MNNLLKDRTYTWWQIGVFKLALLLIGIAIGAYWQDVFMPFVTLFIVVGVMLSLYVGYISYKQ